MSHLERRIQEQEELALIEQALDEGRISKQEYDYVRKHNYGIEPTSPTKWPLYAAVVIILGAFGLLALWGGTITGYTTYPGEEALLYNNTFTNDTTLTINATNTTMIKLTGTLTDGTATVYAQHENDTWTAWTGTAEALLWTDYQAYPVNETILVETELVNASYWLVSSDGNRTPVQENFSIGKTGEYTLEALTNETKEQLPLTIGNETTPREAPSLEFSDACEETCNLPGTPISELIITVSSGATFTLDKVTITEPQENTAPAVAAQIPDVTVDESAELDLSPYFTDPDGDELSYEINNLVGVIETIEDGTLRLESSVPGSYDATVYASDGNALAQQSFTITVLGAENTTGNTTLNGTSTDETNTTNETVNATSNETTSNTTTTRTSNETCTGPVNQRPPECFEGQLDAAYSNVVAPLKDKQQNRVGRFTRYGNLIIRGQVVEDSTGTPERQDFTIGYETRDGFERDYTATAWIDTDTGDLHLTGQLYQEQGTLSPPQYDTYIVQNNNGIILGYFDERAGDLYLKANIVQLGRP